MTDNVSKIQTQSYMKLEKAARDYRNTPDNITLKGVYLREHFIFSHAMEVRATNMEYETWYNDMVMAYQDFYQMSRALIPS